MDCEKIQNILTQIASTVFKKEAPESYNIVHQPLLGEFQLCK